MIKKGTICVRLVNPHPTHSSVYSLPTSQIGYIFAAKQDDTHRAFYTWSSSITDKNFRLATDEEILHFNNYGITNISQIEPIVNKVDTFKLGDRVKIAKSSRYYKSGYIYNPIDIEGTITDTFIDTKSVRVKWINGKSNSYQREDLVLAIDDYILLDTVPVNETLQQAYNTTTDTYVAKHIPIHSSTKSLLEEPIILKRKTNKLKLIII